MNNLAASFKAAHSELALSTLGIACDINQGRGDSNIRLSTFLINLGETGMTLKASNTSKNDHPKLEIMFFKFTLTEISIGFSYGRAFTCIPFHKNNGKGAVQFLAWLERSDELALIPKINRLVVMLFDVLDQTPELATFSQITNRNFYQSAVLADRVDTAEVALYSKINQAIEGAFNALQEAVEQ